MSGGHCGMPIFPASQGLCPGSPCWPRSFWCEKASCSLLSPVLSGWGGRWSFQEGQEHLPLGLSGAGVPSSISAFFLFLHLVIGRGGEQINKIQQDSGCKVQISPGTRARFVSEWAQGWAGLLVLFFNNHLTGQK